MSGGTWVASGSGGGNWGQSMNCLGKGTGDGMYRGNSVHLSDNKFSGAVASSVEIFVDNSCFWVSLI